MIAKQHLASFLITAVAFATGIPSAFARDNKDGFFNYTKFAHSQFDSFTASPTLAEQQWMQEHFFRMNSFTTYFDAKTSWFPNATFYQDFYSIGFGSSLSNANPSWIMHDKNGNLLYLPWGCGGGHCPGYAADITNPAFRAYWIAAAQTAMAKGYLGVYIDDVNMNMQFSDGSGNPVTPMDSNTGLPMTTQAWMGYAAQFLTQIQQALPGKEIDHNAKWFAGPSGIRDADPNIQQQILASSNFNMEMGLITDSGLTGGTGTWSIYQAMAFIDRVHALGRSVTLQEYVSDLPSIQTAVAAYFLISNGTDRMGDGSGVPTSWWSGYGTNLGVSSGPRTYVNGIYQRTFSNGMVILNEPGGVTQTIPLPRQYYLTDGTPVTSVTLNGHQGVVLVMNTSGSGQYLSDLPWTSATTGWSAISLDSSPGGNQMRLGSAVYPKGVGVHSPSDLHYNLAGACSSFTATVGIDHEISAGYGAATVQVFGDNKQLYVSGSLVGGGSASTLNVDVSGVKDLDIRVTKVLGNDNYNRIDWANPILTCTTYPVYP